MNPAEPASAPEVARFRWRLFGAILAVVAAVATSAVLLMRRNIASDVTRSFEREFQGALAALHHVQDLRHTVLLERSRALARRPRLRAALEDGALDLLYPSARDELRDAIEPGGETTDLALRACFYRFLDEHGQVLPPSPDDDACGALSPEMERQLNLPGVVTHAQTGYLVGSARDVALREIIATPVTSSETGRPIAGLVLGFEPVRLTFDSEALPGFASGVWLREHLNLPAIARADERRMETALQDHTSMTDTDTMAGQFTLELDGGEHLVFYDILNPDSQFPPAYEVCVFPLAAMHDRLRHVTWQVVAVGSVLLLGGFVASHQLARRFARPVAALAQDSRDQRAQRRRVEAELETTSAELERAARFSADASHQLKTPVTVMRAGLEELIARGTLAPAELEEVSTLIHQTYRLSTIIDDLLLLSRMDAGQLKIQGRSMDLALLIAASLDDLEAAPDEFALSVESDVPPSLGITGEKRYVALILQNLLENARKYNRPGGRIRVEARQDEGIAIVTIGNTTRRSIPPESQGHIFERFHRGAMGENVPGYGIGLNLARDLARLHQGDLRLVRSDAAWTEFEVRFPAAPAEPGIAS